MTQAIAMVEYGDPADVDVFERSTGPNKAVRMNEDDSRNHTVIYCNEGYAQDLFDAYVSRKGGVSDSKDIGLGESVRVNAITYNTDTKVVKCETVGSGALVLIPLSEFVYDISAITAEDVFDAVITKSEHGSYAGTCKNPTKYKEEIEQARRDDTWFTVKVVSLIRGGYKALYRGTIECFIPGSHAAANIISDFQQLIGKELPVMVDNYDWSSRMYVVSYKKYVKQSMPVMINEIKYGHKYTGRLTSDPTEFGLFIELDNYYTGLAHRVDFGNYEEVRKQYKAGDEISVYVKNVTEKRGNYRIVLTLSEADIDKTKLTWYRFKSTCQNRILDYVYNGEQKNISVTIDTGESISISLPRDFNTSSLENYRKIKIQEVNVLRQEIKFDFCK